MDNKKYVPIFARSIKDYAAMGDGFVIFLVLMGLFVFKVLPQMKAMQKEQADQTGEEEGSL
ncbi:MAG: hypothetical protein J1E57_12420, partial [Prevotella sp.]|nr:hypothetical protein [Prevotella sp.]